MFASFNKHENLCTFMTDRLGGVSANNYSSFNLGLYSEDRREDVLANRTLLCRSLQIEENQLFVPKEVHGDRVVWVDVSTSPENLECDALVTTVPGLCVGVTTADCVPVLLYDEEHSVCAAVHAGWKGVVGKILPKTITEIVSRMNLSPASLHVEIHACISQHCFEVGEEVVERFAQVFAADQMSRLADRTGYAKPHIDLRRAVEMQALSCGVPSANIWVSDICTYRTDSLFSARRDGFASGRMLSGVIIL